MDWNGQLSRVIVLQLLPMCLLLSAGPVARAEEHDWGRPPENDAAVPLAETEDIGRWQRYYPASAGAKLIGCNAELVFTSQAGAVQALSLASGELLWQAAMDTDYHTTQVQLMEDDYVLLWNKGDLIALNLADGAQRWRIPGLHCIARGDGGLWLMRPDTEHNNYHDSYDGIAFVSEETGLARWELDTAEITDVAHPHWQQGSSRYGRLPLPVLAVRAGGEIQAYGAEGLLWSFPMEDELNGIYLHALPQGLLVCEGPDSSWLSRLGKGSSEFASRARALHEVYDELPQTHRVSLLDPENGNTIWTRVLTDVPSHQSVERILKVGLNHSMLDLIDVKADGEPGRIIPRRAELDNASGELGRSAPAKTGIWRTRPGWSVPADSDQPEDEENSRLYYSLNDLSLSRLTLPDGVERLNYILSGRHYLSMEDHAESTPYGTSFRVLYCLPLGPDGHWQESMPRRFAFPQRDYSIARRFMASPMPLEEEQLMRDFIATGLPAFATTSDDLAEMNFAQIEALLELAIHYNEHAPEDCTGSAPLAQLLGGQRGMGMLADVASPELEPMLEELYVRQGFAAYGLQICGLIAMCGGERAAQFLEQRFSHAFDQTLELPGPPYNLRLGYGERESFERSETIVMPGGGHVFAYIDPGLIGNAVCLAIDDDGDGDVDRCLPTGLSDVYSHVSISSVWEEEVPRPNPLSLAGVDGAGNEIVIGHHRLLVAPPDPMARYDHVSGRVFGNEFVTSTLSLAELQRDSDGDGLTDVMERYTFSDPTLADTDGDGFDDAHDRYPRANPDTCGVLERGIARALLAWSHELAATDMDGRDPPDHLEWFSRPFQHYYWSVDGSAAIPGFLSYDARGWPHFLQRQICLVSEEQLAGYDELMAHASVYGYGYIGMYRIDPLSRMAMDDERVLEYFGEQVSYPYGDYLVSISPGGSGHEVVLVYIDGELYPILSYMTWIS